MDYHTNRRGVNAQTESYSGNDYDTSPSGKWGLHSLTVTSTSVVGKNTDVDAWGRLHAGVEALQFVGEFVRLTTSVDVNYGIAIMARCIHRLRKRTLVPVIRFRVALAS